MALPVDDEHVTCVLRESNPAEKELQYFAENCSILQKM
jgi:hypothetical protein